VHTICGGRILETVRRCGWFRRGDGCVNVVLLRDNFALGHLRSSNEQFDLRHRQGRNDEMMKMAQVGVRR
jgi:hypothetical protein